MLSFPNVSARLLLLLVLWICVALSLRYGYYRNYNLALGPNSSRLVEASSIFVEQVQVKSDANKSFFLYGFLEKPELSFETNWTRLNYLFVQPYSRQGISLWLNKGSKIRLQWEIQQRNFGDALVVLIKGENNFETLMKEPTSSSSLRLMHVAEGKGEAEYTVEEDDSYYIGAVNLHSQSIVMKMKVDLSSKMYDTTKAKSFCSPTKGLCRLKLLFPHTQYVVLATPNEGDDASAWYVEYSFVIRLVAYVIILGITLLIICVLLKYLEGCENGRTVEVAATERGPRPPTETDPLVPTTEVPCLYGTIEKDTEDELCDSSNDSSEEKLCVICYDEMRNCFFVPCGHCATCYSCAQRIMDGETKPCPICRRYIHKVRKVHIL